MTAGPTKPVRHHLAIAERSLSALFALRAIPDGQQPNPRGLGIQDDDGALFERRLMLPKSGDHVRGGIDRQNSVPPQLDDAWTVSPGEGEQPAEVEIVGEHDEAVSRAQSRISRSGAPPSPTSLQCLASKPELSNTFDPVGRKVHVEQQPHGAPTGTSCSSTRHAA